VKLVYIYSGITGFKKNDEILLNSLAEVRKIDYINKLQFFNPKLFFDLLWCEKIIIWFASFHAIPAIILNYLIKKPMYIIAGGYDVANVQKINYGSMQKGYRKHMGKWILSKAETVIAVSKSNRKEIIENGSVPPKKISLIYNAIPETIITHTVEKKNQVLTVGEVNEETYLRKGLDRFIKIAKNMPTIQFIHIGKWSDNHGRVSSKMIEYVKSISPSNIYYLGFVDKKELEKYYEESKIYLQLSRHEAFGVSVVEAMSFGCIPIVSNAFGLPEVVGTHGYIVSNVNDAIKDIERTLLEDSENIDYFNLENFSVHVRTEAFKRLLAR